MSKYLDLTGLTAFWGKVKEWTETKLAGKAATGHKHTKSDITDFPPIPSTLKNPNALTFTGAVSQSYDGSKAVTVDIPRGGAGLEEITYANLVTRRNGGTLTPGTLYRITDYVTTVANDPEAQSAKHPFDIIVLATAADTLSEEARAVKHNGDMYFAKADLNAWRLWYCLDNDTTRFQWADKTSGKGVVYRLIDEWGNDCPYDFKNVQFKRYKVTDNSPHGELEDLTGQYIGIDAEIQHLQITKGDFVWVYTFSLGDRTSTPKDASLLGFNTMDIGAGYGDKGYWGDNVLLPCTCRMTIDNVQYSVFCLNNVVWFSNNDYLYRGAISGNRVDSECVNMTLAGHGSHIMHDCMGIIMGDGCYANTLGVGCSCITFGNYCNYNTFGNYCYGNTFGNNCDSNTFGNNCDSNTFGNYCYGNTFGNYLRYLTINDGVQYVNVTGGSSSSSYVQNAQVLNGTAGSSTSSRLTITFTANAGYCQFAGKTTSGTLKIWTPANLV